MSGVPGRDVDEHCSPYSFEVTVERLTRAMAGAGLTIFARIDHAANAKAAGLRVLTVLR